MSHSTRANQPAKERQDQVKAAPTSETEGLGDLTSLTLMTLGLVRADGEGRITSQTRLLNDPRLPAAQRRTLAKNIGAVHGNHHLNQVLAPAAVRQPVIQRHDGEPAAGEGEKTEKRYTVKLTTGERSNLTEGEALSVLFEAHAALTREIELYEGEHKLIKENRDNDVFIGLGGWLTDLAGEDFPPVDMWDEPKQHLARAQVALWTKNIEAAGNHLAEAHKSFTKCKDKWISYKDQLPNAGTKAQIGIVVVAVIAVVVITVAAGAAGGGAAAGGTASGGTAAGGTAAGGTAAGGTAAGGTAAGGTAAGGAAAGGVAVGGGVATAEAMATTLPGVSLVNTLITEVGAAQLAGNGARAVTVLTAYASTPSGRQTLLKCAQVVSAHMQQPGLTRQEFQMLKQVAESFYQFAGGG